MRFAGGSGLSLPDQGFHVIASSRLRAARMSRFKRRTVSATRSLPRAAASSTIALSFHSGESFSVAIAAAYDSRGIEHDKQSVDVRSI